MTTLYLPPSLSDCGKCQDLYVNLLSRRGIQRFKKKPKSTSHKSYPRHRNSIYRGLLQLPLYTFKKGWIGMPVSNLKNGLLRSPTEDYSNKGLFPLPSSFLAQRMITMKTPSLKGLLLNREETEPSHLPTLTTKKPRVHLGPFGLPLSVMESCNMGAPRTSPVSLSGKALLGPLTLQTDSDREPSLSSLGTQNSNGNETLFPSTRGQGKGLLGSPPLIRQASNNGLLQMVISSKFKEPKTVSGSKSFVSSQGQLGSLPRSRQSGSLQTIPSKSKDIESTATTETQYSSSKSILGSPPRCLRPGDFALNKGVTKHTTISISEANEVLSSLSSQKSIDARLQSGLSERIETSTVSSKNDLLHVNTSEEVDLVAAMARPSFIVENKLGNQLLQSLPKVILPNCNGLVQLKAFPDSKNSDPTGFSKESTVPQDRLLEQSKLETQGSNDINNGKSISNPSETRSHEPLTISQYRVILVPTKGIHSSANHRTQNAKIQHLSNKKSIVESTSSEMEPAVKSIQSTSFRNSTTILPPNTFLVLTKPSTPSRKEKVSKSRSKNIVRAKQFRESRKSPPLKVSLGSTRLLPSLQQQQLSITPPSSQSLRPILTSALNNNLSTLKSESETLRCSKPKSDSVREELSESSDTSSRINRQQGNNFSEKNPERLIQKDLQTEKGLHSRLSILNTKNPSSTNLRFNNSKGLLGSAPLEAILSRTTDLLFPKKTEGTGLLGESPTLLPSLPLLGNLNLNRSLFER